MTHEDEVNHWKGLHMREAIDATNLREQIKSLTKERDQASAALREAISQRDGYRRNYHELMGIDRAERIRIQHDNDDTINAIMGIKTE